MIEEEKLLQWIQNWFSENCDGDWEHNENFTIRTLDNPGWSLEVNLEGTVCEQKEFSKLSIERSEDDWCFCFVRDGRFHAAGGPKNLIEMITVFKEWAEKFYK